MSIRHFLELSDLPAATLAAVLDRAGQFKRGAVHADVLRGRTLVLLFEYPSTRTRLAFEVAARRLGGSAIFLDCSSTQMQRGELLEDTARVLSSMTDIIALRTSEHDRVVRFAEASSVPVINALSQTRHPCQLLADIHTFSEHRGAVRGQLVAWVGDGNNVCNSYINAARCFDFRLNIACPPQRRPDARLVELAGQRVRLCTHPEEAVSGAALVATDVWASMGGSVDASTEQALRAYQVTAELMRKAAPDALFMHCLPAHRGEEVTAAVLEGPWSVVWDEAENRLHTQQALLECLLTQAG